MATSINPEIVDGIRLLITQITGFPPDSAPFKTTESTILSQTIKDNVPFYLSRTEVDREVDKMCEKYVFHSFVKHAKFLKKVYTRYIGQARGTELTNRLNIVKLMLLLSNRPTERFWTQPHKFDFVEDASEDEEENRAAWAHFLNEGINVHSFRDESSEFSDLDSGSDHSFELAVNPTLGSRAQMPRIYQLEPPAQAYDLQAARSLLLDTIQRDWWKTFVDFRPNSSDFEANVTLNWHKHLERVTGGLVLIQPPRIVSEYKVLREIMWQFAGPHNSLTFSYNSGILGVKDDVGLSSVRPFMLRAFIQQNFLRHLELVHYFADFVAKTRKPCDLNVPLTYRGYGIGVEEIMAPMWRAVFDIEAEITRQNETWTLISLARRFKETFSALFELEKVHRQVHNENFKEIGNVEAAMSLISEQRKGLLVPVTQTEFNIRLTLYLHSIKHYLTMLSNWFVYSDRFFDPTAEFLIVNGNEVNTKTCPDADVNIHLAANVEEYCQEDGVLRVLSRETLNIARNIQLLTLLQNFDRFGDETIWNEFIEAFLQEVATYNGVELSEDVETSETSDLLDMEAIFEDVDDECFIQVFKSAMKRNVQEKKERNLFETISGISRKIYPVGYEAEKILLKILNSRFTVSGLMVKQILMEKYEIDLNFRIFNYGYLWCCNLIYPFYAKLFRKLNKMSGRWGRVTELITSFQDAIMDEFPEHYEKFYLRIEDEWQSCRDPVQCLDFIKLEYDIGWPLDLIITANSYARYLDVFGVMLKMKWAKFTLSELTFEDGVTSKAHQVKLIRHLLLGLFSNLNANVFNLIEREINEFQLNFEKANDLQSIIEAHGLYIGRISNLFGLLKAADGFSLALVCTKELISLWRGANVGGVRKCYGKSLKAAKDVDLFWVNYVNEYYL